VVSLLGLCEWLWVSESEGVADADASSCLGGALSFVRYGTA